ncbi:hypothetical protein C474_07402 [Halogeometricum pallidum JCM 14848]|uniref:Uncharacterized protein n=1 Tax=Halogeometricum pallidum JCM 14848 TaxID=1227487 RepID=M0DAW4_HALPD|nr:hypothetical protein [Halogeometricum pallidum]ELZ32625.1 hypothetical protein C474_07402 [Halogeometricum pallidum JCM 14848]
MRRNLAFAKVALVLSEVNALQGPQNEYELLTSEQFVDRIDDKAARGDVDVIISASGAVTSVRGTDADSGD